MLDQHLFSQEAHKVHFYTYLTSEFDLKMVSIRIMFLMILTTLISGTCEAGRLLQPEASTL